MKTPRSKAGRAKPRRKRKSAAPPPVWEPTLPEPLLALIRDYQERPEGFPDGPEGFALWWADVWTGVCEMVYLGDGNPFYLFQALVFCRLILHKNPPSAASDCAVLVPLRLLDSVITYIASTALTARKPGKSGRHARWHTELLEHARDVKRYWAVERLKASGARDPYGRAVRELEGTPDAGTKRAIEFSCKRARERGVRVPDPATAWP